MIRLQPDEGMNLKVDDHEPTRGCVCRCRWTCPSPRRLAPPPKTCSDAYERLIMDVIRGNQTLFMRGDEVEAAQFWADPIINGWEARGDRLQPYDAGSPGPEDALMLMHRDGRRWREIR